LKNQFAGAGLNRFFGKNGEKIEKKKDHGRIEKKGAFIGLK